MYFDTSEWPYPHAIHTPDVFAFTEDAVAKQVQAFTNVDPMVAVKSRRGLGEQFERIATQLERALQIEFYIPEGEFYLEFEDHIRSSAIYGTGFMSTVPVFKPGMNGPTLDYVRYETLDFWDIYPDPRAVRINSRCEYIIWRQLVDINSLKDAAARGFPYEHLDDIVTSTSGSILTDQHKEVLADIGMEVWFPDDPETIELLHVFDNNEVRIIANRSTYIHKSSDVSADNPYVYGIPIIDHRYIPQVREFYGVGIPWILQNLQMARNTLLNQRLTNIDLVLSPPMKVKLGSEVDPFNINIFPGAILGVNDHDDIKWEAFQDTTSGSYVQERNLQMDMESATGLTRAARGMTETKRQTGQEITRLQQAALSRFDVLDKRTEISTLREVARRTVAYMRVFMSQSDYERMIGEPDAGFFSLPLDDILRNIDFTPVGTSVSSVRETRAQQAAQAFQVLSSIPPQVGQSNLMGQKPFIIDYYEAISTLLQSMEIPNTDKFLKLLPPPQPQNMQPGMIPGAPPTAGAAQQLGPTGPPGGMMSAGQPVQPMIQRREQGGPIDAGQPYLVGERGPEVIIPSTNGNVVPNYGTRSDGTSKGSGWLGVLQRPDGGISTELSIGVNIGGKEVSIPTLVPGLSDEEISHLLQGGRPTDSIVNKAVQHALPLIQQGKSPFYEGAR